MEAFVMTGCAKDETVFVLDIKYSKDAISLSLKECNSLKVNFVITKNTGQGQT